MSLISHWRARKKFLARTSGKPLWFLIGVLILVLLIIRLLGRIAQILPERGQSGQAFLQLRFFS